MPYSPLKVNQRFGGTCYLHLQGLKVSQARNQHEAGSKQKIELFMATAMRTPHPTAVLTFL
jgi:hypothetical protein